MDATRKKPIHLWMSLGLFAVCLALPGYYVKEWHEPHMSLSLLLIGWLGPIDDHYSWFANVFFLIALLKYREPKFSYMFGFIALAFALSFLGHEKILIDGGGGHAWITAYGLGYVLWVASIGILSVGQYSLSIDKSEKVTGALLSGWVLLVLSIYSFHYFIGDNSQYSINVGRDSMFEEKCHISRMNVFKKTSDAKGIFIDPDWGASFKKGDTGNWQHAGVGKLGSSLVNSGLLLFYEKNIDRRRNSNIDNLPKYRRYELGDYKGIEADHLNSEYAVITKSFDIPKKYGMYGAEIVINDLRNEIIIATTSYLFDRIDRRFCGHAPNDRFSASGFIIDTMNLTKKYPSAYENQ